MLSNASDKSYFDASNVIMDKGTGISFDALFNNASMGILVANRQGMISLVNPFLLKQFGYSEAEVLDAPIEKLIPARFHNRHKDHVRHYNQHPNSRPMGLGMDLFAVRKDGTEFPVEVSLGNYEAGDKQFVIAFVSDISKRKAAELGLKQLNDELEKKIEERTGSLKNTVKQLAQLVAETEKKDEELNRVNNFLNNIWAHAEAIIFVTDINGTIKMFNPTAERHLGYKAAEVIDVMSPNSFHASTGTDADMVHPVPQSQMKDIDAFDQLCDNSNKGTHNEYELEYIRKDRTRFPVSLTLTAMRDPHGEINGYLGIATDISERKKAELDLRMSLEKEKELSELKSRFVSLASHEFRTPLSTVLSSAFLITQYNGADDQPKREKHIQRIVSSVNMLTDILNDFLSVGKIEEGKIQVRHEDFNLEKHIADTTTELNGTLKQGQSIQYVHKGESAVFLDKSLLKHIVINLLSNAIKFSPEYSVIQLHSHVRKDAVELVFIDKGIGISPEDQQHLFERFFRGTNVTNIQGTGLGLHIVAKYAELMNGTVTCQSEVNVGTTFIVTFHTRQ